MAQWVQHMIGQGKKWKVNKDVGDAWWVDSTENVEAYRLPKSEYRICEPPAVWKDVTETCEVPSFTNQDHCEVWHGGNRLFVVGNELVTGYRLRKVPHYSYGTIGVQQQPQWAFIVEKKEAS